MSEKSYSHLPVGTVLNGQYRIDGVLGRGGFGITYAGYDLFLKRKTAVKECFPMGLAYRAEDGVTVRLYADMESKREAFERSKRRTLEEAQTLVRANALPHAVRVYSGFLANETAYLVMEYVDGETLASCVRKKGPLTWEAASALLLPLAVDLYRLHQSNIMHRDISPDNIMIRKDTGEAVLLDFGASHKILNDTTKETSSLRMGYAPIEQYSGKLTNQDGRTDEHAFCATLYYALTGKQPQDAMTRYVGEPLAAPSSMGVRISTASEAVLLRGMAVDRGDRYGSMLELRAAFEVAKKNPALNKVEVPTGEEGKRLERMLLSPAQPAVSEADVPAYLLCRKLGKRAPGYEEGLERKSYAKASKPAASVGRSAVNKPSARPKTEDPMSVKTEEILRVKTEEIPAAKKNAAGGKVTAVLILVIAALILGIAVLVLKLFTGGTGETPVQEATAAPAAIVTQAPTEMPTAEPTEEPTEEPIAEPAAASAAEPIAELTEEPAAAPTEEPATAAPTAELTAEPTAAPTAEPTAEPTAAPTAEPTAEPTAAPTAEPTATPTAEPTAAPTEPVFRVELPAAVMEAADAQATAEPVKRTSKDEKYGYLEYADGTCKIRTYNGDENLLEVPAEIDGLKVVAIDGFDNKANLQEVVIPEGVKSIEPDAFSDCSKLRKVSIPESVTSIGKYAFYACEALEGITIPAGVEEIEENAFDGCTSLKNVMLTDGVKVLGNRVFYSCSNLLSITIPASMERVGNECFKDCVSLKEVIWYPSACVVGGEMFSGCEALERISGYSEQSLEIAGRVPTTHMQLQAP